MVELAPKKTRYTFWVVLGVLSTVIPEVVAGSDLYPFFKIADYLIVIPLYSLHSLILWYVVWTWGKPRLYTLFPAGAIFGLYEAYMTKVIWNPSWSETPVKVGGIAIVETMILVLFWHSFLAFIIPLFVAESLTSSNEIQQGLPLWLSGWLEKFNGRNYLILPFIAGSFQAINTSTIQDSLFSGLSTTLITMAIITAWKRTEGSMYSFRSLLPTKNEFRTLLTLLLLFYGLMIIFWTPELLPGVGPQITVWLLYLFFGSLLYLGLKKSREDTKENLFTINISDRNMTIFGGVFVLGSVIGKSTGFSIFVVYFVWAGGILFGLFVLYRNMNSLLSGN